jgi:chromosome segregation ATPase
MDLNALYALLIIGALLVIALLLVVFVIPTDVKRKKPRRERVTAPDLESRLAKLSKESLHQEASARALRRRVEEFESKEKEWQKLMAVEQAKSRKLQDKLVQERQWQGEEAAKYEKKGLEIRQLQNDLKAANDQLAQEHSRRLKLEGEIRDLKQQYSRLNDARRGLDVEIARLTEKYEDHRQQVRELRKENAFLAKQKEDTAWVAKSEYLKLEHELRKAESELKRRAAEKTDG